MLPVLVAGLATVHTVAAALLKVTGLPETPAVALKVLVSPFAYVSVPAGVLAKPVIACGLNAPAATMV